MYLRRGIPRALGEAGRAVNNAAASVATRETTPEGIERHWATNVLGPYPLATRLITALQASGHGRIITVSARAAGGLGHSPTPNMNDGATAAPAPIGPPNKRPECSPGPWPRPQARAGHRQRRQPRLRLTPLTTKTTGPLKLLIVLTRFAAQTPLDGADTALWAAASPELEGESRANSGASGTSSDAASATWRRPRSCAPSSSSNWLRLALPVPACSTAPQRVTCPRRPCNRRRAPHRAAAPTLQVSRQPFPESPRQSAESPRRRPSVDLTVEREDQLSVCGVRVERCD